MSRISPTWSDIDLIGKIADLKHDNYRLTLAVSTMMELLVEKGLLTHDDISRKAADLDAFLQVTDEAPTSARARYPMT
ncbi:hypothetical protein [Paenibacillus sp. UMB4589-SE434]|uniref:hypothetical protein n=1 Tax=Paenibacillus sp. UMB4589-SE434 TaxID=3046314 RepID=UPI00254E22FD|nr:hypothetical protein [Paenibacillus sp. UMB4589-SE434]MDK8181260.1 hypothetical protein [Paenibacillus sp. UMB4589-SE434]